MNDYIDSEACAKLGLPEPKAAQTHNNYVLLCISQGITLNTHICRFIGIGNLHSVIPVLKKKRIIVTVEHKPVFCPRAKKIKPRKVDVIYMTPEQISTYQEQHKKNAKPLFKKEFLDNETT